MTRSDDPAFPGNYVESGYDGITIREYFAAQALIGLLAFAPRNDVRQYRPEDAACDAVEMADALIAALNKKSG